MVAFVLFPVGFVVGMLLAPLAEPFVGDVPRRRRIIAGSVTAAVYGLLGWRVGLEPVLVAMLYLAAVGTLLGFIDVEVKRLPDRFTLPSYAFVAVLLGAAAPFTEDGPGRFQHALIGMALLFLLFLVQAVLVPSGIGLGDVKLSGVLGLQLGWLGQDVWLLGLLATFSLGGLAGVGIMIARRTRKGEFPFGPCMLAGAFMAVISTG